MGNIKQSENKFIVFLDFYFQNKLMVSTWCTDIYRENITILISSWKALNEKYTHEMQYTLSTENRLPQCLRCASPWPGEQRCPGTNKAGPGATSVLCGRGSVGRHGHH